MVVDIQGVGDLYTDPQIHTHVGTDYGDGNLGVKGFALFFSSHVCNDVCKSLGLTKFDMAETESKCQEKMISCMSKFGLTQSRGCEEAVIGSPSSCGEYFRRIRCRSDTSGCSDDNNSNSNDLPDISEVYEVYDHQSEGYDSTSNSPLMSPHSFGNNFVAHSIPIPISACPKVRAPRVRNESSCLDSAFTSDEARNYFAKLNSKKPSCVSAEKGGCFVGRAKSSSNDDDFDHLGYADLNKSQESILGKVWANFCYV